MKIKYITFVVEGGADAACEAIKNGFSKLDLQESGTEICFSHGEMLKKLSESFAENGINVLAIDVAQYIKTKSLLFKAMNFKCLKNGAIISKIKNGENASSFDDKQLAAQSAIPLQAQAFVTEDGLFSGFGIEADGQIFIVVPNDGQRVDEKFIGKIYDFVLSNTGVKEKLINTQIEQPQEDTKQQAIIEEIAEGLELPAQEIPPVSVDVHEAVVETEEIKQEDFAEPNDFETEQLDKPDQQTETVETEQDQTLYGAGGVDDLVAETFANISVTKIKLAFGVQDDNVIVDEYFKSKIVFKNTGLFTIVNNGKTCVEENEQKNKESLSRIARSAMLNANASVGMAVSDVLEDDDGKKYVLSAMCDIKKTNIYKIYALPDENDEDIVVSAIGNMFSVLNERVMQYNEKMRRKNEEESKQGSKKEKGKAGLIVLIVILVLLAAAVGVAVYAYYTGDERILDLIDKIKEFVLSITQRRQ